MPGTQTKRSVRHRVGVTVLTVLQIQSDAISSGKKRYVTTKSVIQGGV